MNKFEASALAHPNIAFIKYWGNFDDELRIPLNSSISMNLAALTTTTKVVFDDVFNNDSLFINEKEQKAAQLERVSQFLDHVRSMARINTFARVESSNSFPMGAGIASSASAFAALSLAASTAAGLNLDEAALSRLARLGSGSAARSIPGGFTEWCAGKNDCESYARSIAPADHWGLVDCIAIIAKKHKDTGSSKGHQLAGTSPFQKARIEGSSERFRICREAICSKDFNKLAGITELESNLMHAVMITSDPPLFYWEAASLQIMKEIPRWRREGLAVFYTLDAGPNVHVISNCRTYDEIKKRLLLIPGVKEVICSPVGNGARLI